VTRRRALIISFLLAAACSGTDAAPGTTAPATTTTVAATTTTTLPPPTTTTSTSTTTTVPPVPFDPAGATIPAMQEAMTEGRLTAVTLTRFYLLRIQEFDDGLDAIIYVNPRAILEAAALDRERAAGAVRGPLHGIPVVLKDNIGTADMPTTAGSLSLDGFIPNADATQVARLRAAGAIVIAKTNLHEFARDILTVSSLGGQTRNPYDTARYPGGSSGGTGAALAAEFAAAGLGTDTCGSVRLPTAFNHLYGLRPTIGLTPTDGVIPLSYTEDTVGPMARHVIDLAILMDATAATGSRYTTAAEGGSLQGVRIGVIDALFEPSDPAVTARVRGALELMAANGAEVVSAPIPNIVGLRGNATGVFLREFRFALDEYLAGQPDAPVQSLAEIFASGKYHPIITAQLQRALAATLDSAEYRAALDRRPIVRDAVTDWMDDNDLDALAYPASTYAPATIGSNQRGNNCGTASVGGLPALVVPAGFTPDGLPVGLELMGRQYAEETLIAIAAGYEQVAPEWTPPEL
jgi:Asp-tRNA(Asn)/Glu-tRNA(Gln) amidotransferase A subunit family amidase